MHVSSYAIHHVTTEFTDAFNRHHFGRPGDGRCVDLGGGGPLHRDGRTCSLLLEKVPQDLFHSVYFEYEENSTHDRLLSLNYAFCHIKRLIKTSEPVYTD